MSVTTLKDLRTFIPISKIVKQAVLDMYGDYEKEQARYLNNAIRSIKKLTRETLKSPKRYAILPVNQHLNNAVLPCDFKEEIGVYVLNSCNEKVALVLNPNIVNNQLITEYPCEPECQAKCKCYPKQLCDDIQTTQVINKITIDDTQYDQTVTTTLLPNGEYYIVTTTPVLNTVTSGIDYINTKEYVTTFDLADCGCIKPTERNSCKLEACCFDAWCCYCAPCANSTSEVGGYRIFEENGTIVFDGSMVGTQCYLEYRGFLPKSGNEFLVPEVAEDCVRELTKYYGIQNKKGTPKWERDDQFNSYTRERSNMTKVMGRMNLADIIHSALNVPKFSYNYNRCGNYSGVITCTTPTPIPSVINTTTGVISTSTTTNVCKPMLITIEGIEMTGGVTYNNSLLNEAVSFRIFANPFNRFMNADEFTVLPSGGFTLLTGVYGAGDWFDIFLKWCLVPTTNVDCGCVDTTNIRITQ